MRGFILLLCFFLYNTILGQSPNQQIVKGNESYKKNDYNNAAQSYKKEGDKFIEIEEMPSY